jgi:nitrite reductase/ring-hydroxylating ferredoxin subunit
MTRKEFMLLCSGGCLALVGLSMFTEAKAATIHTALQDDEKKKITLLKTKFEKKKGDEVTYRKYIIVNDELLEFPVIVYRFEDGSYNALLMRCTHRGAELNAGGDTLSCSAHGSEFNNKGEVLEGPADESLKTFPVTTDDENIYINIA